MSMTDHAVEYAGNKRAPVIPAGPLRRLNRLYAQAELGKIIAAQTQAAWEAGVVQACEDLGIRLPEGANVNVDFASGELKIE